MNYFSALRHIIPTFLIIALCTILGLAFTRWGLTIQYDIIDIKEEVWTLWIPVGLPWIPILVWLRPRLRVLKFKSADNNQFFFQLIAAITITSCLIVSQNYITTSTGKLQLLSNINEIDKLEKARYYNINNFIVASFYGTSYTDFRTSGKHNQTLNIAIYFAAPILVDSMQRIGNMPMYWYGVKYKKSINNKISDEEKDRLYKVFYDECIQKMNNYNYNDINHFERTPNSVDKQCFLKAIEYRINKRDDNIIILEPRKEKFEDRNGNKFQWIFGSFGIGFAIFLIALMFPAYSDLERKKFFKGKKPKQDDLIDTLNFLIPKGEHFATSIILDLNILVIILMVFSGVDIFFPNGRELLEWGANRRFETTSGEWWRLLTSMFSHGGISHLFINIIGLLIAGICVESLLGRKNYFILYILSGLFGSLASIWWNTNTISVGASGAIFGLYGAMLGLLLTKAFPKGSNRGPLIFVGIYALLNLIIGFTGGTDNAAHIGGFISGGFIGTLLFHYERLKNAQ